MKWLIYDYICYVTIQLHKTASALEHEIVLTLTNVVTQIHVSETWSLIFGFHINYLLFLLQQSLCLCVTEVWTAQETHVNAVVYTKRPWTLYLFVFCFWDMFSLYNPICPGTHSIDQNAFRLAKIHCLCLLCAVLKGMCHNCLNRFHVEAWYKVVLRALSTVLAQVKVSDSKTTINWNISHSWDTVASHMAAFCPCPKNLIKSKFKGNGAIHLPEEISRQHNIEYVAQSLFLMLLHG